jgi:hypothetical protein
MASFLSRLADRAIRRLDEWLPEEPVTPDPLEAAAPIATPVAVPALDPHKNPPDELLAEGYCYRCHGTGEVQGYTGGAQPAPPCEACGGTGRTDEEENANRLLDRGACGCGAPLSSLEEAREHARIEGTACADYLDEQEADADPEEDVKTVMVDENGQPWSGNGCSTCTHWEDDAGGCCHPALVDHQSSEPREDDPLGQDIEGWREGPIDWTESGAVLWPYSGQSCPGHEIAGPQTGPTVVPAEDKAIRQALSATRKKDETPWREALAVLRAGVDKILAEPNLDARAELAKLVAVDHRLTSRKRRERTHDGCSVAGCENPHRARGYCGPHYQQAMRGGPKKPKRNGCTVEGCEKPHRARGYCGPHYQQFMRGSL